MPHPGTGYEGAAGDELAALYQALDPTQIYEAVVPHLPAAPAAILDVGAGSGRDAAWLAALGHTVLAVEPSASMREVAQRRNPDARISWLVEPRKHSYALPYGSEGIFANAVRDSR